LPAVVVGSAVLEITVKNNAATPNTERPWNNSTNNADYTSITVNVAPYITGLSRASTYNTARSAQGWYAFSRGEIITLTGFNLKHNTGATTVSLPGAAPITPTASAKNSVTFTVPAAATSGALGLTANGVKAVNTNTDTGFRPAAHYVNPWNAESSASPSGSDPWEDFTSAHVWQSDNTVGTNANRGSFPKSVANAILYDPAMTVNPADGVLHGIYSISWQSGADASRVYRAANNADTATRLLGFSDSILEGDIQYANSSVYAAYNVKGRYSAEPRWNDFGGIYIKGPGGANSQLRAAADDDDHYLVEKSRYNNKPDQFASPHLAVFSSGTGVGDQYLHVSYYDTKDKSIKYRYHKGGEPGTMGHTFDDAATGNGQSDALIADNTFKKWINLDGGYDDEDTAQFILNQTINGTTGVDKGDTDRYLGKFHKNAGDSVEVDDVVATYGTQDEHTLNNAPKQDMNGNTITSNPTNRYLSRHLVAVGDYVTANQVISEYGNSAHTTVYRVLARAAGYVYYLNQTSTVIAGTAVVFRIAKNPYDLVARYKGTITYVNTAVYPSGTATVFTISQKESGQRVVNLSGRPAAGSRHDTGRYNAIDVTSNGHPVIAYFDETSQVLRLAYCSDTGSDYLASKWTVMDVFKAADPNRSETGSYVTMRIDRAGNNAIHIAAYNTAKSALIYIKGTWSAAASGAPVFGDSLAVDTSSGGRADISLDSAGNPWITYTDNNEAEGYGKLKLAYLDSASFARARKDINGRSVAGWEALNIPILFEVKDDRLSVENFPVRGQTPSNNATQFWNAAVGYLSKDLKNFRIAYRAK
ncbi:MAG: hypothetical protein LBT87_08885, partial [Treponema sp.]|nr:hypothetical protein [Treponema sp.]